MMKRLWRAIAELREILDLFKIYGADSIITIGGEIVDLKERLGEAVQAFDMLYYRKSKGH
jgi:hypothetical protein